MLIDIRPDEFEKMARAGFFESVHLRAQDIETARARCKSLGLQTVAPTVYRTGSTTESAADIYYNLVRVKSGFWITKRKGRERKWKVKRRSEKSRKGFSCGNV